MRRLSRRAVAIAVVVAPLLLMLAWRILVEDGRDLDGDSFFRTATEEDWIDSRYDPLLAVIVDSLAKTGTVRTLERATLNDTYLGSAINIYVVDAARIPNEGEALLGMARPAFKAVIANNAVAIAPNVIVLDSFFLGFSLFNVFNDILGFAQMLGGDDQAIELASLTAYRRLRNMQAYNEGSADVAADLLESGGLIAEAVRSEELAGPMVTAMTIVLAHEVEHLDSRTDGRFRGLSMAPLEGWLARRQRAREEVADERAVAALRRRFPVEGNPVLEAYHLQAVVAMAKYLRDTSRTDFFNDFRGLDAKDVFVNVAPGACPDDPELRWAYFDMPDGTNRAWSRPIPLMTASEFGALRSLYGSDAASRAHAHGALRAEAFLRVVEEESEMDFPHLIAPESALLSALDTGVSPELGWGPGRAIEPLGLSVAEILESVPDSIGWHDVVNCPFERCEVGFLENGGWIEVWGEAARPLRVEITLPLDIRGFARFPDVEDASQILETVAQSIRLVMNLDGGRERSITDFFGGVKSCGRFSTQWSSGGSTILLETLNESDFLRMIVVDDETPLAWRKAG